MHTLQSTQNTQSTEQGGEVGFSCICMLDGRRCMWMQNNNSSTSVCSHQQVGGGRYSGEIAQAAAKGDVLKSLVAIAKQDGVLGYWRGNLPQVKIGGAYV